MPTNQPIVLLRERDGDRYLPIWIGAAEATAIAYAQQGVVPPAPADPRPAQERHRGPRPRPDRGAHRRPQGRRLPRHARSSTAGSRSAPRSSDAIALALRTGAAIVAEEELLDEAGVAIAQEEDDEVEKFKEFLDQVSAEDFETTDEPGPSEEPPSGSR